MDSELSLDGDNVVPVDEELGAVGDSCTIGSGAALPSARVVRAVRKKLFTS